MTWPKCKLVFSTYPDSANLHKFVFLIQQNCVVLQIWSAQGYPMLVPIQHINFQGVVPFVQQYPTNQAIANGLNSYCWQGFQSYTPSHVQHQDPMETGLFR